VIFLCLAYIQKINVATVSKLLFNPFAYATYQIKGNGMFPNFIESRYYISKKLLENEAPLRGEAVIAGSPFDYQLHLKRIVGLPGDTIMLKNGLIYINNSPLAEPYLPSTNSVTSFGKYLPEGESVQVPKGSYFLLNDNRNIDDDSRTWGFVQRVHIHDHVLLCYKNCSL
jgi:signal peptidase I